MIVSARALSYESPTLPTEPLISLHRTLSASAFATAMRGGTGHHRFNAALDLMTGPDWTASGRWLIFFGFDGKIHGAPSSNDGLVLGSFVYDEWYDVEIWYKRTQDSTVVLAYYIDGTYAGVVEVDFIPEERNLAYLELWSGDTLVWFDDVMLLPR